jgi:uncharacterized protein DUF4249
MKVVKLLLLTVFLIMGCSEPIDLKVGLSDPKVVVDGYISDLLKPQKIELSFSSTFYETGNNIFVPLPIRFALVIVTDDLNNEYIFTHDEDGVYLSEPFKAESDRSYQLTVNVDGEIYKSSFESLPESNNQQATVGINYESRTVIDEDGDSSEEFGVQSFAIMQKTANRDHFIWAVNHHFAVVTGVGLCYAKDFDLNQVIIVEDTEAAGDEGQPYKIDLSFHVPDYKMNVDFAIDGTMLSVNQSAFDYWQNIQEQIDKTGGLFDSNSNTIRGNMFNANGKAQALGYFGVHREVNNYYFYNLNDLPVEIDNFPCPGLCINCESIFSESASDQKPPWWR